MSGFKNFLLRGNLVETAVALIMALSFAAVVSTFVAWLTAQLPKSVDDVFSNDANSFGAFMNAVIAFVVMAAVVYFVVVVPYTKAKERFFPAEASGPTELDLLTEIRDSLASRTA
ncbi:large conductance mechanosensitive channel protein MscL [Nocardioides immobilis]|uniref:Large conductance mechanosensitive channel protein MscL n=1 Tax=Nocardioides immobilis TaxID=2049295 RepID=A0A417XU07_9ACTN|nr:MscL family protein [Nocardioides immobilis]RHW23707.1 large conductance mechanosensitive channel protein MscL [Nocardioides immobilis]